MNSPPEELSPSPSSPSSSSPPPEEVTSQTAAQIASSYLSPNQTKRRLPSSSSAHIIAREGRENKSRRKEIEREREDVLKLVRGSSWESRGEYATSSKAKDDLVDMYVVEYMRKGTLQTLLSRFNFLLSLQRMETR